LITGILNHQAYLDTVATCGFDGSNYARVPNKAPVCDAISQGKLIPGADVISTYSRSVKSDLVMLDDNASKPKLTICPENQEIPITVRYAEFMTASCKITALATAECSCPIFWRIFQLVGADRGCHLGDDLVWSASYDLARDVPK
jgi:hypothetical protein